MTNPSRDESLTHSGKEMLSGLANDTDAVTQAEIDAFLAKGNKITVIPSKFPKSHTTRTKSHMKGGGRWGAYNVGGNSKIAATRRSA